MCPRNTSLHNVDIKRKLKIETKARQVTWVACVTLRQITRELLIEASKINGCFFSFFCSKVSSMLRLLSDNMRIKYCSWLGPQSL